MIPTAFDCQSCGACCQAVSDKSEYYVRLKQKDLNRLSSDQKSMFTMNLFDNYGSVAAMCAKNGKCSALTGTIGEKVSCEIYGNRPDVCRNFEMGDDCCLLMREEAGLPLE